MFEKVGTSESERVNQIAEYLYKELNKAPEANGQIYVGYPIFFDPIQQKQIKLDISVVSNVGVVLVNYFPDTPIDYAERQDTLYTKIEAKFKAYDFLVKHRDLIFDLTIISFCEKPILEKKERLLYLKRQNKIWKPEDFIEFQDQPDEIEEMLNQDIGFPIFFRIDYDPRNFHERTHPASHMTINNLRNCRIPLMANISLSAFVEFVLNQIYDVDHVFSKKLVHEKTIAEAEKNMLHFEW